METGGELERQRCRGALGANGAATKVKVWECCCFRSCDEWVAQTMPTQRSGDTSFLSVRLWQRAAVEVQCVLDKSSCALE